MHTVMFAEGWYNVYDPDGKLVDGFDNPGDAYDYAMFLDNSIEEWDRCYL